MKSLTVTILTLILTGFTGISQSNSLQTISLPDTITQYVNLHFPEQTIIEIDREIEGFQRIYEIELNDGTEIDITKNGEPLKIETKNAIPVSVIPATVLAYVNANFPQNSIKEWEIKKKRQKIELTDNRELIFDLEGNFIRFD